MTREDRKYVAVLLMFAGALTIPLWRDLWNLPAAAGDSDALKYLSVAHALHDAVRRYGEYPLGGVFFAACGALLDWRRSFGLLCILTVAVVFSLGPRSPLPVVAMLTAVPVFNMMGHYGVYATLVIVFCVCGMAAIGFEQLRALVAASRLQESIAVTSRHADSLVVGLGAGTVVYLALRTLLVYGFLFPVPDFTPPRESFYQIAYRDFLGSVDRYRETPEERPEADQYYNIRRGVGTITWNGNMVFAEHARARLLIDRDGGRDQQDGYRDEVYCMDGTTAACETGDLQLTYNTIRFRVKSPEAATVVLNMNYDPGWSSPVAQVANHDGLLAVRVGEGGVQDVLLQFLDSRFIAGLKIAAAAALLWCAGGVVWCRWVARREPKG